jgi:hypothetical protein
MKQYKLYTSVKETGIAGLLRSFWQNTNHVVIKAGSDHEAIQILLEFVTPLYKLPGVVIHRINEIEYQVIIKNLTIVYTLKLS